MVISLFNSVSESLQCLQSDLLGVDEEYDFRIHSQKQQNQFYIFNSFSILEDDNEEYEYLTSSFSAQKNELKINLVNYFYLTTHFNTWIRPYSECCLPPPLI